ncbi:hypothetical protein FB45DRAFT_1067242 [Roridomyces roridus]|uniref:Uncharacterized protein n=1 Tax=Roridomyces roridus TaxID=1738132 RepID=A0AAD7B3P4_9AGAR|nr:hypothetical protein FB45DRAFT_1067242 [Roridomyces roridus]
MGFCVAQRCWRRTSLFLLFWTHLFCKVHNSSAIPIPNLDLHELGYRVRNEAWSSEASNSFVTTPSLSNDTGVAPAGCVGLGHIDTLPVVVPSGPSKHPINPGIIIGPILAVPFFAYAVLATVGPIIRRRRRAKTLSIPSTLDSAGQASPGFNILRTTRTSWQAYVARAVRRSLRRNGNRASTTPSESSTVSSDSNATTRQLYISNQVNRAREKVRELEEEVSETLLLRSQSVSQGQTRDAEEAQVVPQQDESVEAKLQRALQEIEGLNERIREMEQQRGSDWALGLSDELPPEYSE